MPHSQKYLRKNFDKKMKKKALRVKYLRNLEKFFNGAISALKKEDFDKTKFEERMLKNAKFFEKNPAVNLNSTYAKNLEFFCQCLFRFFQRKKRAFKSCQCFR